MLASMNLSEQPVAVSRPRAQQEQRLEIDLGSSSPARTEGSVEATLVVGPGHRPRVRLSQLGWGVGVGWYAQRSIEVDLAHAQQISELLDRARSRAEALEETWQAASDAAQRDREPVDFMAARAEKARSGRPVTHRMDGEMGRPPVEIACRRGAVRPDDAPTER
jgi:hypothetical protein